MWRLVDSQIDQFIDNGRCGVPVRVCKAVRDIGDHRPARRTGGGPAGIPRRARCANGLMATGWARSTVNPWGWIR